MTTVINVENLSKKYVIARQQQEHSVSLREALTRGAKQIANQFRNVESSDPYHEVFWALKDVSFDIQQGDRVGIIGRNGAGKSTLLKILSRITEPASGRIKINGRVSSLLEVGTGFHPELTGRENVFLNGAILGMSKAEIKRKFDEIVAFAEVEQFLDTPVKRYSSGMYVRLAFSVAAHLEPEILIVDEVLAVGDAQFQRKCLGKMESVGKEGRTILFVSHNTASIKTLCTKGIVLKKGAMSFYGEIESAVNHYHGEVSMNRNQISWTIDDMDAPENDNIRLKSVSVKPAKGTVIDIDSGIEIKTEFICKNANRNLDLTLKLFTLDGICMFATGVVLSSHEDSKIGCYSTRVEIPPHLLNSGIYKFTLIFGESQKYVVYKAEDIISFEVEHTTTGRGSNMNRAPGVIRPSLDWTFECNETDN